MNAPLNFLALVALLASTPLRSADKDDSHTSPSERLAPLVKKMDAVLLLFEQEDERPAAVPHNAALLRAEFAGKFISAPPKRKPIFDAAMVVCDRIAFANEERTKMKARINSSGVFHGKGKAGSKKKGKKDEDEKFFAGQIRADWKKQRTDLLAQINGAFLKLKEAEARAQK